MNSKQCSKCAPYKLHSKIYWEPKLKALFCEVHFTELLEKEAKAKKK